MSTVVKEQRQSLGCQQVFLNSRKLLSGVYSNKCSILSVSLVLLFIACGVRYTNPFQKSKASTKSEGEMSDYSVVYVTVPSLEIGKKIGRALVEDKLAACVNLIPGITSIYRWEEKVEEDSELLLMIKTQTKLQESLTNRINALHPFDVPEVISVPIINGSSDYLNWIKDSTK